MFGEINAYVTGDIDPGLFVITGKLMNSTSMDEAEKAIDMELQQIIRGNISDYEIEKVKNKFESVYQFSQLNALNKAMSLSYFELLGDADLINHEIEKYRSISKEEIKQLASKLFKLENSSTLYYLSKK